jgi:hypothetical protein
VERALREERALRVSGVRPEPLRVEPVAVRAEAVA